MNNASPSNFARKWRPRQFDTLVGQDLVVRMLKNSLYRNQFFPVYLLSGQRGCGKTSTARIFASAINCQKLSAFQADPRGNTLPCLLCPSCCAMAGGTHPDCIEIDAASNTGVDNVRMIIEAASFLPVMGRKKIYIIDEAHMLSKAAFNAFLKILEEPPASVMFMLATTDPEKILETVRSRCFQLFFGSLPPSVLVEHLEQVCTVEQVPFEHEALHTIVKEAQGSVRDALNIVEQVRFAFGTVNQDAVLAVLGRMGENHMLTLWEHIVDGDAAAVLVFLQEIQFEKFSAQGVWQSSAAYVRALLYVLNGVEPEDIHDKARFKLLVVRCSPLLVHYYLEKIYEYELVLARTAVAHGVLEFLFITLAKIQMKQVSVKKIESVPVAEIISVHNAAAPVEQMVDEKIIKSVVVSDEWKHFIQKIETLSDPLLVSIFKQGQFREYDVTTGQITVLFEQNAGFFSEWLKETKNVWHEFVVSVWGNNAMLHPLFGSKDFQKSTSTAQLNAQPLPQRKEVKNDENNKQVHQTEAARPVVAQKQFGYGEQKKVVPLQFKEKTKPLVMSQSEEWNVATQLVDLFGGTLEEVVDDHEKIT